MNLIILKEFFANYSLSSIIMAIIIYVITQLIEKFIKSKKVKSLSSVISFVLGMLLNLVYSFIVTDRFFINTQILSAGFMSGWLSLAIKVIIDKIIKGENLPESEYSLVISGIIEGYVPKNAITDVCRYIEELISNKEDEVDTISKIAHHLSLNALEGFTSNDTLALASLIFASTKQIKE